MSGTDAESHPKLMNPQLLASSTVAVEEVSSSSPPVRRQKACGYENRRATILFVFF